MKTTIELRAWHIAEEKMCEVVVLTLAKGAFLKGVLAGVDVEYAGGLTVLAPPDGRFCDFAEFELLRYTGRKDSKGVKLFEGDICKKLFGSSSPVFAIAWDDTRMTFIQHDGFNPSFHEIAPENIEKIGDIYQNPELMPEHLR